MTIALEMACWANYGTRWKAFGEDSEGSLRLVANTIGFHWETYEADGKTVVDSGDELTMLLCLPAVVASVDAGDIYDVTTWGPPN